VGDCCIECVTNIISFKILVIKTLHKPLSLLTIRSIKYFLDFMLPFAFKTLISYVHDRLYLTHNFCFIRFLPLVL
jgi:hypothetical protein